MSNTKEQILEKAKIVLADLHGVHYDESNIENTWFVEKREIARGVDVGQEIPAWVISIKEPLFESIDFMTMSDETGEPLYYQTKHVVAEVVKDADGKYTTV
ncbi:MAG: hypothetical protein ACKVOR_09795 [Flavobacteriales bacterium]